jgi:predicted nucleic acid-binding protein
MRVFLDTNIVLDVLLNRPGLLAESRNVILHCEKAGDSMFIAWHGLATVYYLLRRGRKEEEEAMREVDKLLAWARVADAGDAIARSARGLGFSDFEDALQAASAEACGADCTVTRNIADFTRSNVVVMTPADFLAKFQQPS